MKNKKFQIKTERYSIEVKELKQGGPGGYESVYLTSEGDSANNELYDILSSLEGKLLAAENRSIRQRNGIELIKALKNNRPIGIASGFKPSGAYHFGHKLASSAVSFFQKNGAQIFIPVADIECEMDTDMNREDYEYWAADNLLDWGANGVNLDAAHVYLQSEEKRVNDIAYTVARSLSFSFAADTYGLEKLNGEFPFLFAGITQVGDIILPQHPDFDNYHSFMVSGQDQDGHMKMTVGLVEKSIKDGRNIPGLTSVPSGFYIPHIRGLSGQKASSSKANGTLYLGSGPNKLLLDERIKYTKDAIDSVISDDNSKDYIKMCSLDMVRYIDYFNNVSDVDFGYLIKNVPNSIRKKLESPKYGYEKSKILDDYLVKECEAAGQNNVELIRDNLKGAIIEHRTKRRSVFKYAIDKVNPSLEPGWGNTYSKTEMPNFWDVPNRAIVSQEKRNKTQWHDIIYKVKDKIIP
jgi:tryptophanyl-tRNA synthetase